MHSPAQLELGLLTAAFPPGPWRLLCWLTAGALVLGLVSLLGAWVAARRRAQGAVPLADFDASTVRAVVEQVRDRVVPLATAERVDAVAIVHELMRAAVAIEASDIHFSPLREGLSLTFRVHGTLVAVDTLPARTCPLVINRIKVLARLDLHVRSLPQDGRLVAVIGDRPIEARVSTLPTETGERAVLRLVSGSRGVPSLDSLGFSSEVSEGLHHLLSRPQGLLFVNGPVGSGKTTTIYAALDHITATRGEMTTLVTLEDPIELQLPFATQTQMHARSGMTFANTLRSVLRQDPNVLMVGEIRDAETADIAVQAALTGHLILTTVHADSAVGPFGRLVDMHIEPFLLASSTIGSLSQRLVRTLCPACRSQHPVEPMVLDRFARLGIELPDVPFFEPRGCDLCENQGYVGRGPIAELLVIDAELRQAVHDRESPERLRQLALAHGMVSLLDDGLRRARGGDTSLTEVLRVVG